MQPGRHRRAELISLFQSSDSARIIVLAFGGVELDVSVEHLPRAEITHWLIQGDTRSNRADVRSLANISMPLPDVLASADAVITKPGYGIFTEAAYHGLPVASIERTDWPETPYLLSWLMRQVPTIVVSRSELESGSLLIMLERLWSDRSRSGIAASGANQAAEIILGFTNHEVGYETRDKAGQA